MPALEESPALKTWRLICYDGPVTIVRFICCSERHELIANRNYFIAGPFGAILSFEKWKEGGIVVQGVDMQLLLCGIFSTLQAEC